MEMCATWIFWVFHERRNTVVFKIQQKPISFQKVYMYQAAWGFRDKYSETQFIKLNTAKTDFLPEILHVFSYMQV